jgi:dTDP-4-amino-4,6-dideoxygalactose transaminase
MTIPMLDLKREYQSIKSDIDGALAGVLDRAFYVLGENVEAFEREFAAYIGTRFAVGVGSGMAALHLALRALEIGPGHEVITVANTAAATAMAIVAAGAQPVFCDIDDHFHTLDPEKLSQKITSRTRAILPVHLFGQPADMAPIGAIARDNGLFIIEDACQSHGAHYRGEKTGSLGDLGCFSFYPSKNLGCYGDGGMVTTNDAALADRLRMLRNYGQRGRYEHLIMGHNSRLDELQAAVLRVKLKHLDIWNQKRRQWAAIYHELLRGLPLQLPVEQQDGIHVYHLYVIRVADREGLGRFLASNGVITNIHYPLPLYRQPAFADRLTAPLQLPVTEQCTAEVISLPLFPWITEAEIKRVAGLVKQWLQRS